MLMLSSQVVSSFVPPKSLHIYQIQHSPISTFRTLLGGSRSKRSLGRRIWISDQKNMSELVENDEIKEEIILRNGPSGIDRNLEFRGFEESLNRMSKWLVLAPFILGILWKHDAEAMWIAMGLVLNSLIYASLKKILNHERPVSSFRSDPGMPSAHSQSIFYIAWFAVLSLFCWQKINIYTWSISSIILMCGSYLSWLRVSQNLHTRSQVVVGAMLGSTCSITWFWMWRAFMLEAFIANVWIRITVILGFLSFSISLLLYAFHHLFSDNT